MADDDPGAWELGDVWFVFSLFFAPGFIPLLGAWILRPGRAWRRFFAMACGAALAVYGVAVLAVIVGFSSPDSWQRPGVVAYLVGCTGLAVLPGSVAVVALIGHGGKEAMAGTRH